MKLTDNPRYGFGLSKRKRALRYHNKNRPTAGAFGGSRAMKKHRRFYGVASATA